MKRRTLKWAIELLMEQRHTLPEDVKEAVEFVHSVHGLLWAKGDLAPTCCVCGLGDVGEFSLRDDLWRQVCPDPRGRGVMHLKCVEDRLGRPIRYDDLRETAINVSLIHVLKKGS